MAIAIWGVDQFTTTGGLAEGDTLKYVVWDASANTEYPDVEVAYSGAQPFLSTSGKFSNGAIYELSTLAVSAPAPVLAVPVLASPAEGASLTTTTAKLVWRRVAGAAAYEVQVSTRADFSSLFTSKTGLADTTYTATALANGTTYYWRVRATGGTGTSAFSAGRSFKVSTPTTPPPSLAAPVLTSPAEGASVASADVKLVWRKVTGAATYDVQVSTKADFSSLFTSKTGLTDSTYTAQGLADGSTYYWRVRAVNANTTGAYSSGRSFKITLPTPPPPGLAAPVMTAPANESRYQPTSVTLSWEGVADASAYDVQVSTEADFSALVVEKTGLTGTSTAADGLEPGTVYHWRVRATSADGIGPFSAAWSFSTLMTQEIALTEGWNLISSYVMPSDARMEQVFSPVVQHLSVVKNEAGSVYSPEFGVNAIGSWSTDESYLVHMSAADTLVISGSKVISDTATVALNRGWNMIPYLRQSPLATEVALAGVSDHVVALKNSVGQLYIPKLQISSLESMAPGDGYMVYVRKDTLLQFSAVAPEGAGKTALGASATNTSSANTTGLGSAAHVVLRGTSLPANALISVLANGRLVGRGRVSGGMAVVVVKGEDIYAEDLTGAKVGETLELVMGEVETMVLQPIYIENVLTGQQVGLLEYQNDQIWLVSLDGHSVGGETDLPREFGLEQNYPNPFNPRAIIEYQIAEPSHVSLKVYDVMGREVQTLTDGLKQPGHYRIAFEAGHLPSGVYVYRLVAGSLSAVRQMVLVK